MTIGADSALHRIFEAVDAITTTASRYEFKFLVFFVALLFAFSSVVYYVLWIKQKVTSSFSPMKKCLFDWSFVLLSTAIRGLLSLKLWGDIVGKTFFVSLGWQMIYPKSKGVSKLLPFFLLLILFCFLSSLESWRKLVLQASTVLHGDFDTPQMYNSWSFALLYTCVTQILYWFFIKFLQIPSSCYRLGSRCRLCKFIPSIKLTTNCTTMLMFFLWDTSELNGTFQRLDLRLIYACKKSTILQCF